MMRINFNKLSLLFGILILVNLHSSANNISDVASDNESDKTSKQLEQDLKLYPNPAVDYIFVQSNQGLILKRIAVLDMLGNVVWENKFQDPYPQYKFQIPLDNMKKGIYFIEIEANDLRIARKISKE